MKRKRQDWLKLGSGKSYAHRVHQPLQCLVFITPLLLFYQIASALTPQMSGYATDGPANAPVHVVAFILLLKFFSVFGAAGTYLPLAAVVAILLAWHLARKDPWDFDPRLYLGMLGESLVWGLPFFVIGLALARHVLLHGSASLPMAATTDTAPLTWRTEVILSVGAGIYEELLFRLIAITLLNMILVDIFEMKLPWAITLILIASSLLFSGYHYLGNEPFNPATFVFRATLGLYLAGLFIFRGFGITVGAHTAYDLYVVAFTHLVLHK